MLCSDTDPAPSMCQVDLLGLSRPRNRRCGPYLAFNARLSCDPSMNLARPSALPRPGDRVRSKVPSFAGDLGSELPLLEQNSPASHIDSNYQSATPKLQHFRQ